MENAVVLWVFVILFLQLFLNITWHLKVKLTLRIVPLQCNSTIQSPSPIHGYLVILLQVPDHVMSVLFTCEFYTKFI